MRRQNGLLALVLAGLAMTVGLELVGVEKNSVTIDISPRRSPAAARVAGLPETAPSERQEWVETILARPLLAPSRRPDQEAARPVVEAPPATLPRVTGILVNGNARRAMFAAQGEARPVVVGEGDQVEGLRVQSIEPGRVTLVGPQGTHELLPSFDPSPPQPRATVPVAQAPMPVLPGLPVTPPPPSTAASFSPFQGLPAPSPVIAR